MENNNNNNNTDNTDKYFIEIEPMYCEGVGGYRMVASNIRKAEIFRQELLKYKNDVEHGCNKNEDMCGYVFYEYVYKIVDIKQINDDEYEYKLFPLHEYEYEPDKVKFYKLKKVNWKKKIIKSKIETKEECELLKLDHVYNTITNEWHNIALKDFNILLSYE